MPPDWKIPGIKIKARVERFDGQHVRLRIYSGPIGGTLALCGVLMMNPDEYQAFAAALMGGAHSGTEVEIDDKEFLKSGK